MIDVVENSKLIESPDVPFPLLHSSDGRKLQQPVFGSIGFAVAVLNLAVRILDPEAMPIWSPEKEMEQDLGSESTRNKKFGSTLLISSYSVFHASFCGGSSMGETLIARSSVRCVRR